MERPAIPYVVRQGDHLPGLAFKHGFDADVVWNDKANDALRELRKNPLMLAPGDILHIPTPAKRGVPFSAGARNRYVARVPKVDVHLVVHDQLGTPFSDEPYVVEGLGDATERATGPDGAVTLTVPVFVREVSLLFVRQNLRFALRIGDMDPLEEISGVAARLANLHFLASSTGWTDEQLTAALTAFQALHELPATGALDHDTRERLRAIHGS